MLIISWFCLQGKEGLFFLGEVKKLLGEQEMKQALDFGPICAIMDWHPCMLSYAKVLPCYSHSFLNIMSVKL